jgi:WXG100 family type VII secretion target
VPQFMIEGDAVRRQANNLGITADDLRRVLDQYHAAVENSFGTWFGLGADAMRQFDGQFRDTAENLITALNTLQTEVDQAGVEYDNNETNQQAAVQGLSGGLGGFNVPN